MGACFCLAGSVVTGTVALAGLSAILLTLLLFAAFAHPLPAAFLMLLIAGALAK